MDTKDLKIARLEREQKKLIRAIGLMLVNIEIILFYSNLDTIPKNKKILFVENQETVVKTLTAILEGE